MAYYIYPRPLETILADAAREVYNAIAPDVDLGKGKTLETCSSRMFVDVILDHLFICDWLTATERECIFAMSNAAKRRIVAAVQ